MSVTIEKKRFTVDEYYQMAEVGILEYGDRVELINGEIIKMSPINSPHGGHVNRLNSLFNNLLGTNVIVSVQNPLHIGEYSEPEPDIMLLKPRDDFYTQQHPEPEDVLLLIEVSDSTLVLDRKIKLPLYAQAGVVETWLVNLVNKQVEVYTNPVGGKYQQKQVFKREEQLPLHSFALSVEVKQVLS